MTCHLKKILFIGATIALPTLLVRAFIVINTTASLPPGIYYRTFEEPKRGDIVFVSPPDKPVFKEALKRGILSSGHSEAGTCHLIKIMAATDGDEIEIRKDGMFVNGEKMYKAGANIFVCGTSSIFHKSGTVEDNAQRLKDSLA